MMVHIKVSSLNSQSLSSERLSVSYFIAHAMIRECNGWCQSLSTGGMPGFLHDIDAPNHMAEGQAKPCPSGLRFPRKSRSGCSPMQIEAALRRSGPSRAMLNVPSRWRNPVSRVRSRGIAETIRLRAGAPLPLE